MHDPQTFEARLTSALRRYADQVPTDVDAVAFVRATRGVHGRIGPTGRFQTMSTTLKLAAAAVLALAIGVGLGPLLPRGPDVAAPSSPSPVPSPTAPPPALPSSRTPLAPGTYSLGSSQVPGSPMERITVTVPEGWSGIRDRGIANLIQDADDFPVGSVIFWLPTDFYRDPCDTAAGLMDPPVGPTVDDFIGALTAAPGYTVTAPAAVDLLGYHGKYVEETAPADVSGCTDGFSHPWQTELGAALQYEFGGSHDRLWVMDIDGQRLVIDLPISVGVPTPTGTDPADMAQQQAVFDSIRIAPAPTPVGSPSGSPAM